jgi:PAS domain S-box-containing protein
MTSSNLTKREEAIASFDEGQRQTLLQILLDSSPYTGERFFTVLAQSVKSLFSVRFCCVSEVLPSLERTRAYYLHGDLPALDQFKYGLNGPCELVVEHGQTLYAEGIKQQFPTDPLLRDFDAESCIGVPLRSRSGDVIGVLMILHDQRVRDTNVLSSFLEAVAPRVAAELERRQREVTLARNEAKLRLLQENSRDAFFYYELLPQPHLDYVNPAIEEITSYPPEAFLANPAIAIELIHEDDREKFRERFLAGDEEPLTVRIVRPDGQVRWLEYRNFAFLNDSGEVTAIGGTIRDTTAHLEDTQHRELSEQYRIALLEALPDTLLRLNADGRVLDYVSQGEERMMPELQGDATSQSIDRLLPAAFVGPILRVTHAALRSGTLQRLEFDAILDNQSMTYEARCRPFREKEVLLILRDITAITWHAGEADRRRFREELDDKIERKQANIYGLTYREMSILHLIVEGQADKQIAESLGISTYTVNKHVGNILGKMEAASRTEAGVRAVKEGLVS